jgi:hypothetical protein
MDSSNPVQIVARNIRDFMRLWGCHSPAVEILDSNVSEEYFLKMVAHYPEMTGNLLSDNEVQQHLVEAFSLQPFPNLLAYFGEVRDERRENKMVETWDGLGIVNHVKGKEGHNTLKLSKDHDLRLPVVESFFSDASYESKLAFLRDAQSMGLLYQNIGVKEFLRKQLILMGLEDEADRLAHSD